MLRYTVRRVVAVIPVVLGILFLTFLIKALIPTDVVANLYAGTVTDQSAAEAIANIRAQFDLDLPWYQQFWNYLGDVFTGDLGTSVRTRQPVADEIGFRYVNTLKLAGAALMVAAVVGVTSGIVAAYFKGTWLDVTATTVSLFGLSMPAFFLSFVVILVFSVWLRWIPVIGDGSLMHLVLPAATLGLIEAAPLSRVTRSSMLEVLEEDYIRAARARGLHNRVVLVRHGLANALLPVVTVLGLQVGGLLGGAFIIEVIFGWHGIGELAVRAIQWRDFTITQAIILVGAGTYVLVNLLVDLLYMWIDPRIRYD